MSYIPSGSFTPQDLAYATLIDLTSVATTLVINANEGGIISALCLKVLTNVTGTPTARVNITIDGGTTSQIVIYSAANMFFFNGYLSGTGTGATAGDSIIYPFNAPYNASIVVSFQVTGGATGGTIGVALVRSKRN